MLDSLFLSFREGLEAALVIGIILITLTKLGRNHLTRVVVSGTIAGVVGSAVLGFILFQFAQRISHEAEEILEVSMMLVAAGLIAYFILWLHRNQHVTTQIKEQVAKTKSGIGLFLLAFLSVAREGMELVIFNLTQVTEAASTVVLGSFIGIIASILVAILLFKTTIKLNLGFIFKGLGLILIFIGGEMFAEGIIELISVETEALEIGLMVAFILPSFYLLFKNDFAKFKKENA
ncbi:FTR1 family protein [Fredinandcohnia sp. QZ13]|uniref:FTR1 family iron permease n=1 Tax=Fredinandcohnia sp. QZ13 TaxID=3073144 RepID=UPI002853045A|nr:FTR1 family protein [Fredinandcohnia sp. QZ13]MDR4886043.1 FTR1 family protein [Fredinandcohnia sp. QZ13]